MNISKIFKYRFWDNLYWETNCLVRPRQKWLTKKIPNNWMDKCELIPLCLFEILKHYVEEENSNIHYNWKQDLDGGYVDQEYVNDRLFTDARIWGVYQYITIERPILEQQMYDAMPDFDIKNAFIDNGDGTSTFISLTERTGKTYEEIYGESDRLEKLIEQMDEDAMTEIIKLRGYLWT